MIDTSEGEKAATAAELSSQRQLTGFARLLTAGAAVLSVALAVYLIFGVGPLLQWFVPLETQYFYVLLGLLLPIVFLMYPMHAGARGRTPWYDWTLALAALAIPLYFAVRGEAMLNEGWEYDSPFHAKVLSFAMWAIVLEALRRAGGTAIFGICLVVSIYPIFAGHVPGVLGGQSVAPEVTAGFHIFGTESVLGIPMNAFANLVIGFLVFGIALQMTGGGAFFLNLAFALLGGRRGGPAKVAIFSSGLMGSMSGSVITNVLTTGVLTIPAMKRVGFRPAYAGGVEACASTGGVLMPPVMGATAFVMASFIEIPYSQIVVAAIFPSLLYYLGLYLQIDAYSARERMKGLPLAELPRIGRVLLDGWFYITIFVVLMVMLLYLQREAQAPFYATAALLLINQFSGAHRWGWKDVEAFVVAVGRLFAELAAILAGVGLIIGALSLSGKIGSITYTLVQVAGDNVLLLLLMGAVTSFILGIGMTVTAAYLFLAVTLAPALTGQGLDKLAVHLFLLYWGMISFITPPVALGAYAAASIAKSSPMQTGLEAMRLGSIIYFVPFFFVLNPALIGRGEPLEIVIVLGTAIAGIALLCAGLQGYLWGVGALDGNGLFAWPARVLLALSGIVLALPGSEYIGYSHWELLEVAAALGVAGVALAWLGRRRPRPSPA
ncbi:MAG: TRAP transporter fused permease subunit [Rhodospirillales bacterium]|nr:TRAP transporter fused permease subunit [Rhodospirillales bacterium]